MVAQFKLPSPSTRTSSHRHRSDTCSASACLEKIAPISPPFAYHAFPDGQSALNLAAARLRHIAGTAWSTKRYLNIELLKDQQREPEPGAVQY
jgi:hypothetical protein